MTIKIYIPPQVEDEIYKEKQQLIDELLRSKWIENKGIWPTHSYDLESLRFWADIARRSDRGEL